MTPRAFVPRPPTYDPCEAARDDEWPSADAAFAGARWLAQVAEEERGHPVAAVYERQAVLLYRHAYSLRYEERRRPPTVPAPPRAPRARAWKTPSRARTGTSLGGTDPRR